MPVLNELPDVDAALQMLDAAESEQTPPVEEAQVQTDQSAQQSEPVVEGKGKTEQEIKPTDTPETAESKPVNGEDKPKDKAEAPKPEAVKEGSAFRKNAERLDKTWKSVNERKTQLDTREAELARRESEFQARVAKANTKFTPEQYESAAANKLAAAEQLSIQVGGLNARADKLEEAGDFDGAEKLRKQAKEIESDATAERVLAGRMKMQAKNLRENPDPTAEQLAKQRENALKHYTIEAAKVYPDLTVQGSQFQKDVSAALVEVAKAGLDPQEHPVLVYHAAQMVALRAAASRVPELEKSLASQTARVKELEKLVTPGGGKEAASRGTQQPSAEDEESSLRAEAAAMSF